MVLGELVEWIRKRIMGYMGTAQCGDKQRDLDENGVHWEGDHPEEDEQINGGEEVEQVLNGDFKLLCNSQMESNLALY